MADALEDGRLVIVDADQHTGYNVNSCVNDLVNDYLVDSRPARRTHRVSLRQTHPDARTDCRVLAEGVGFEPTETQRTSTAFEAVPFVRSGILPSSEASGSHQPALWSALATARSPACGSRACSQVIVWTRRYPVNSGAGLGRTARRAHDRGFATPVARRRDAGFPRPYRPAGGAGADHVFKILVTGPFAAGKTSLSSPCPNPPWSRPTWRPPATSRWSRC